MTGEIGLLLVQDGITSGAIYALLALSLVLVFAVTRVLFVPQGEFVMLGALTLATLGTGAVPGTVWLLLATGGAAAIIELWVAVRSRRWAGLPAALALDLALPLALLALTLWLAPQKPALWIQLLLALALVVPLGPIIYRVAFQPLAGASILLLLFVAIAVHYALAGLGLVFFGAESWRTPPLSEARIEAGPLTISGQSLWILGASLGLIVLLWLFFSRTLWGKALRATAVNRVGARLVGIRTEAAGRFAFTLAALFGALGGVLIAPLMPVFYDSGFLIALKGFVGSVIGGMVSYPAAAAGALLVGILESFSSFWASALKDAIVFMLLIPVLLWRSLASRHAEEAEDGE